MKKIVVETAGGGLHWWRIVATLVVVLVLAAVLFWPRDDHREQTAVQSGADLTLNETAAQVVTRVPSHRFGTWILMVGTNYSEPFCPPDRPPDGSYTRVEREDPSIGFTVKLQRPDGRWTKPVYHPPGREVHLALGAFRCIRHKADKDTTAKVTISRTPPIKRPAAVSRSFGSCFKPGARIILLRAGESRSVCNATNREVKFTWKILGDQPITVVFTLDNGAVEPFEDIPDVYIKYLNVLREKHGKGVEVTSLGFVNKNDAAVDVWVNVSLAP